MWFPVIIPAFFLCCHILLVLYFLYGWKKPAGRAPATSVSFPFVSVLVAVRDEAGNIPGLIESLSGQTWPSQGFEVIVADDHSRDEGPALLSAAQKTRPWLRLLSLPEEKAGKKAALQHAFKASRGEVVLMTDADCQLPPLWIERMAGYLLESEARMVIGPVLPPPVKGLCKKLFALDFIALSACTAGAAGAGNPVLCNGASMACLREAIDAYPFDTGPSVSGDDLFLLLHEKKENRNRIRYLRDRDAAVITPVPPHLKGFFSQRIRWASKSIYYRDPLLIALAFSVFLVNASLLALLFMSLFSLKFILLYFIILLLKTIIDFILLKSYLKYFKRRLSLPVLLLAEVFHSLSVPVVAVVSFLAGFSWKGRYTGRRCRDE